MKKTKIKKIYSIYDILGIIILISVLSFGIYFIYGLTSSYLDKDKSITSDQVWCANCQTYHDQATADQEKQKLTWCINCQKYHEPRDEN